MSYQVKFIKQNIYTDGKPVQKKQIPLSMRTNRITVRVRGWEVDYQKYNIVPKSTFFTALIRGFHKNIKQLDYDGLIRLFNKYVIPPFVPITDFQEMTFFKDGRVWFKRNKINLINK